LAWSKPAFGPGWSRTVGDKGPSTTFSWLNRSQRCAEYIKRWAEQFEDDFFTIIDYAAGRQYVGRFVGDVHVVEAGNDRYNIQGLTFEVVPGMPMVDYPDQWDRWAITQRPYFGLGDLRMACFSANPNYWQRPVVDSGIQPNQLLLANATAGDSVTYEYRGYGFRLWCVKGVDYGSASLVVDGQVVTLLDFHDVNELGPVMVYANAAMPLGIHRVQLVSTGAVTPGSAHNAIVLDHFEVMR
jgi:hypothetical protein